MSTAGRKNPTMRLQKARRVHTPPLPGPRSYHLPGHPLAGPGERGPQALRAQEPRTEREEQNSRWVARGTPGQAPKSAASWQCTSWARWPGLRAARGEVPTELDKDIVQEVRAAVLTVLGATEKARHRHRTTPAQTPRCWKPGATRRLPVDARLPGLEGWKFCTSRPRRKPTLLLQDYTSRGFCTVVGSATEAREMLGGDPVLNKLGVLVKEKVDAHGNKVRKARVICDLRASVNKAWANGSSSPGSWTWWPRS